MKETLTIPIVNDETPQPAPGSAAHSSPMQETLRDAVRQLLPEKRRGHRQSNRRKAIVAGRVPVCRRLELVIDEAIADGVSDDAVEGVALAFYDAVRLKLEARTPRPLGCLPLGVAIRNEEAVEGEMAPLEIDAILSPTPAGLRLLRHFYLRQTARVRDCLHAIDAHLRSTWRGAA